MYNHNQYFSEQITNKRLSHAYLFAGDDQAQKEATMVWIAQSLVCQSLDTHNQPCQSCGLCQRIAAQQVPDIQMIEPDGKQIKVDQIRQLRDWLNRSPLELDFKMAMINQAQAMNDAAANALLTILEEPKSEIYLILNVTDTALVLPTIKSRTIVRQFQTTSAKESRHLEIAQVYQTIFSYLPSKTQGQLESLEKEILESFFKLGFDFYQFIYLLPSAAFAQIQAQLKHLFNGIPFECVLDYLLWLNYQTMTRMQGNAQQSFSMIDGLMKKQAISVGELLIINDTLLEAKQYLNANVASQLVAEKIILDNLMKRRG